MSGCPVQAAFNYADDPAHEGAGFYLILTLRDGSFARGSAHVPNNGIIRVDVDADNGGRVPVFVRCADVMTATVEW